MINIFTIYIVFAKQYCEKITVWITPEVPVFPQHPKGAAEAFEGSRYVYSATILPHPPADLVLTQLTGPQNSLDFQQ